MSDRDLLNLERSLSLKLVKVMRSKSADFIGARSGRIGCNKAEYIAATHPVAV